MTERGLIGAVLYAKDLDRLVAFYAAIIGIEPRTVDAGSAVFESGPLQFVIVRIPRPVAERIDIVDPPEPRQNTPLKLVFAVEDIGRARDRAAALGGVLKAAEQEWEFEGARVCDGHDPEGNVFQLRRIG